MIHSIKPIRLEQCERFIFAFFSASLYTSKAGLYLSASLTLILLIVKAVTSLGFREWFYRHPIAKCSLALFVLGLVTSLFSPGGAESTLLFFRKASILLLLPIAIFHFKTANNRNRALKWILGGAAASILFSLYKLFQLNGWEGQRVDSFWDVGRWAELLTCLIILILFLRTHPIMKIKQKIALGLLLSLACLCVIYTNSRAPILALICLLPIYFIIFNRKILVFSTVVVLILSITIALFSPTTLNIFSERVSSISNISTDNSNTARLSMWYQAINFQQTLATERPVLMVTGLGLNNIQDEFKLYLENKGVAKELMRATMNNISYRDHHNATLTLISSNGLVYTLLFLLLIFKISLELYRAQRTPLSNYGLFLIAAFLIISMFYTNFIELQTIVVFFLLSICLGECDSNRDDKELEERSLS